MSQPNPDEVDESSVRARIIKKWADSRSDSAHDGYELPDDDKTYDDVEEEFGWAYRKLKQSPQTMHIPSVVDGVGCHHAEPRDSITEQKFETYYGREHVTFCTYCKEVYYGYVSKGDGE